ncbi:unnamed protein product [Sphagnum troendelagicum]|uniref:Uncharacterized protein n=1 Tax=Sphagnum troendelagicum TaxID=128251 RepID=A0ABP0TMA4_9BRYO
MRTAPNIAMAPKTSWQLDFLNPRKDVDSAKTNASSQGGLSPSAYFSGSSIGACPASPMTASASKTAACSSYLDSVEYERMENLGLFTDRPDTAASEQCLQMQDLSKPDQSTNYLPAATDSAVAALYAQAGSTSSATPRTNSSSTSTTNRADYKRPAIRSPWESNLILIHQPAACLHIPPAIGTARGRSNSTSRCNLWSFERRASPIQDHIPE